MKYSVENISLFEYHEAHPNVSLVHCISSDARMGAGIALEFTKRFGGLRTEISKRIDESYIGKSVEYKVPNAKSLIFNLVTKEKFRYKPTYESMRSSLEDLKKFCLENNIKHIAMPRIGSGLDRLNWFKVERIIKETFKETDMRITICVI